MHLDRVWSSAETLRGDNMRRIDAFLTVALSAALIFALGGICATHEEDASDAYDPPSVELYPTDTDELPPSDDAPPPE